MTAASSLQGRKLAIIGATGLVGREALHILEEKDIEASDLRLFATDRSSGVRLPFRNGTVPVESLEQTSDPFRGLWGCLFCTDAAVSRKWAPLAVELGAWVVDNSSEFRLHAEVPLIVPTVNGELATSLKKPSLIANPNCTTIQLVRALRPLQQKFGLEDVIVSTYQAVSGAGRDAVMELVRETKRFVADFDGDLTKEPRHRTIHQNFPAGSPSVFPRPILMNVIPQVGAFNEAGYSEEEQKIMAETRKILSAPELSIVATSVRVPIMNVHSESVTVTLETTPSVQDIRAVWEHGAGLTYSEYTTPREISGTDVVGVGRLRADPLQPDRFHFWVVADNLTVGAALNAVEILEILST